MHVECVVYDAFKYGAAGEGLSRKRSTYDRKNMIPLSPFSIVSAMGTAGHLLQFIILSWVVIVAMYSGDTPHCGVSLN